MTGTEQAGAPGHSGAAPQPRAAGPAPATHSSREARSAGRPAARGPPAPGSPAASCSGCH